MRAIYDQLNLTYDQFPWLYEGSRIYQRTWSESRTGSPVQAVESALSQTITSGIADQIEADTQVVVAE